jgi:CubicO group peptidase (beta-lactamase class C family)
MAVGVVTPERRHMYFFGTVKLKGEDRAPDGSTLFALGSLTKAYTGVLLAELVREGKVKLDDPAQKHLPPEFVLPTRGKKPITLFDLATHYSGMPVQPDCLDFKGNPYAKLTPAMIAENLADVELERDSGSGYGYSNYGAGLLGYALAHAAGAKSYEDALVQHVCNPLGLSDTRIRLSDAQERRLVAGYSKKGEPRDHWRFGMLESCGGLFSTATDQMQFLAANLGLVEKPIAAAMKESHAPRRDAKYEPMRIGLCWHTLPLRRGSDRTIVWHNGGTFAARCFMGFVPDAKTGVVILSGSEEDVDPLGFGLLRKLLPE